MIHRKLFRIILCLVWVGCGCRSDVPAPAEGSTSPGVTDTEILVGASLALSGHAGYLGTQTLHGALAYIQSINETGGIHGRKIKLIIYDDAYDPPKCLYYTQKLIVEDRVFALSCYVGTPTTLKVMPLVTEARIPLVGMFTGAHALREPFQRYVINVRASYYQETGAAVQYMIDILRLRRIAVFYQYDSYGFDGLTGTELALRKYGLQPVATGTYVRGSMKVEEGLMKIMQSNAEAVVMVGTYDPCAKFIKEALERKYSPIFFNVSFVGADELARRLGPAGNGVMVTQVVPPPELPETQEKLWGAKAYARHLKQYFPQDAPDFVGLEGYLNAVVLVEGLKRSGVRLDRERFIDAMESIHNLDLGIENTLSFSSTDHQGLDDVYFTRIENERIVYDGKAP